MTATNQDQRLNASISQLQQQEAVLQQAVRKALNKHTLDNVDKLAARRQLAGVADRIVSVALAYLQGAVGNSDLFVHLTELVEMGLRNQAVLSIADAMVDGCGVALATEPDLLNALSAQLQAYRLEFVSRYMDAIVEHTTREREAVYAGMGAAIEAQVQVERELRHDLEQQQALLRDREERFRAILESTTEIIYALSLDGIFDYVSPAWTKLLGYSTEYAHGRSFGEFVHPDDVESCFALFQKILKTGEAQQGLEFRVQHQNGSWRLFVTNGSAVFDEKGHVLYFVGLAQDITEQKAMEAERDRLYETSIDLLGSAGLADGYFKTLNPAWEDTLGWSLEELMAKPFVEFVHPDDVERTNREVTEQLARGEKTISFENRYWHKDGGYRWLSWNSFPDLEAGAIYFVARDVTEQKALEAERDRLYETSIDLLGSAGLADGYFKTLNPAWEDTLGWSLEELMAKPFVEFVHPDDVERTNREVTEQLARGEKTLSFENRYWHKDGGYRWLSWNSFPDLDAGTIYFIARDVTEQKATAQTLTKQAQELQTAAEISTIIASTLDIDELLDIVTDLIQDRFVLYHAHIYLLDDVGEQLTLVAGSGDVGRRMVAEGRILPLNKPSLVANAARRRQGVIVNNVQDAPDFLPNPMLPNTHSEMAVPLLVGEDILGVLDVQAEESDYFTEDDLRLYATLAAQIAIALQNATLFARSEAARTELDILTRRLIREGWQEFTETAVSEDLRYAYNLQKVFTPENGRSGTAHPTPMLKQPLIVQGAEIGHLWLDEPQTLTEDAADIVNAVAERLSLHIENLRLTTQTEQALAATEIQAQRLEMLNVLGAELSTAQSSDDLYRITARHATQILRAKPAILALLQPDGQHIDLFILEKESGAIPMGIHVGLMETAIGAAIVNNRLINIPDTRQSQFAADAQLADRGIRSTINIPLSPPSGTLGTLTIASEQPNAFRHQDENLLRQIASLLAATIERQKLFEQMQSALGETATLYDISARLNAATNPDEIIATIAEVSQAENVSLMTFKLDQNNQPETMQIIANWPILEDQPELPEFFVSDYPISKLWLENPTSPLFIDDTTNDDQLDTASQMMMQQFGIESTIWMPLYQNKRWLGMITLNWNKQRDFSERARRIIQSLMSQTTIVVSQWQLLQQTQERAAQLEELTELEKRLSQASSEADLLAVVLDASLDPSALSVYHVEIDADGQPLTGRLVVRWADGEMKTAVSQHPQPIHTLPGAASWQQAADLTIITNDPASHQQNNSTAQTLMALPLQSAGRWQGIILLEWEQPRTISQRELFLMRQLLDPIAAVFASQRSLAETEILYNASAKLNTAQSYDGILDVLREYTIAGRQVHLVSINLFDRPWTDHQKPEWIDTIAHWSNYPAESTTTAFRMADYPTSYTLLGPDQPVIINDMATDERLDPKTRSLFLRGYGANRALFAPLVTANQWRGYIVAFYQELVDFPESALRRLMVLAAQAAVAIESLRLLRQTEQQLANLTNIQETTSNLSGALSFDEAINIFLQQTCQAVDADSVDIYELHGDAVERVGRYPIQSDKPTAVSSKLDAHPLMQQAVKTRSPATLAINDTSQDEALRQSFVDVGIKTNVTLPLIGRGGIYGFLSVNREESLRQFGDQEVNLLQTLSDQAMIAFERVQLLEETTQRAEQEQRLREITTRVRGSIDVDTIMRTAVQEVGRALGRRTFIYLDQDEAN